MNKPPKKDARWKQRLKRMLKKVKTQEAREKRIAEKARPYREALEWARPSILAVRPYPPGDTPRLETLLRMGMTKGLKREMRAFIKQAKACGATVDEDFDIVAYRAALDKRAQDQGEWTLEQVASELAKSL